MFSYARRIRYFMFKHQLLNWYSGIIAVVLGQDLLDQSTENEVFIIVIILVLFRYYQLFAH